VLRALAGPLLMVGQMRKTKDERISIRNYRGLGLILSIGGFSRTDAPIPVVTDPPTLLLPDTL
jgi:hypothetical protein